MASTAARNGWLRLDDEALLKQCREDRYKASGPGGQRRNKVETALRLHHEPSGVAVQANDSRMLEENRALALRRLRERIATDVRATFDADSPSLPEEFVAQRGPRGSLGVNAKNPVYALVVATALDALAAAQCSYARSADALGVTTSQLVRFLKSDREVWRAVERLRKG